ncbi:MAG TPA: pilus assembly protein TadG-related protein [Mycobacteriales bacterium]|nr:pilus assembly protein TadG-related protein [Mycobacteriales bacterium]
MTRGDDGSLTLLVIGYTLIAAVLVVIGVDVSKVFLAQRSLSSAADAAALAGAQAVDRAAVYRGAVGCATLPVDGAQARDAVAASLDDAGAGLRETFAALTAPDVELAGDTVRVQLHGEVAVPFGRVLAVLLPDHEGGRVGVTADAAATTALTAPAC